MKDNFINGLIDLVKIDKGLPSEIEYNLTSPLHIHEPGYINENGIEQCTKVATTVFVRNEEGKYLVIKQDKETRVVGDNIVGIGGKAFLRTLYSEQYGEKASSETVSVSTYSGNFGTTVPIEETAVRELYEETGGEKRDENGAIVPTGYGINIANNRLKKIGVSDIRLDKKYTNEHWVIFYYLADVKKSDGEISQQYCNEGTLMWVENPLEYPMLPADEIIFRNSDPNIRIEAVYNDKMDGPMRIIHDITPDEAIFTLLPDLNKPMEYLSERRIITENTRLNYGWKYQLDYLKRELQNSTGTIQRSDIEKRIESLNKAIDDMKCLPASDKIENLYDETTTDKIIMGSPQSDKYTWHKSQIQRTI